MIVSKPDFISTVADRCNFSKIETRTVLNAAEEVIAETLARNDAIQFVGFGKFYQPLARILPPLRWEMNCVPAMLN